jgi:hypothetical protein
MIPVVIHRKKDYPASVRVPRIEPIELVCEDINHGIRHNAEIGKSLYSVVMWNWGELLIVPIIGNFEV